MVVPAGVLVWEAFGLLPVLPFDTLVALANSRGGRSSRSVGPLPVVVAALRPNLLASVIHGIVSLRSAGVVDGPAFVEPH